MAKTDSSVHLVLGQLISSQYLDSIAEEINEKLQIDGTISIATLAKDYNLPADFLFDEIIARLGKFIEGFQDDHDPKVILTPAFMSRYRARVRGVLTAITVPTPVSQIVKEFGFDGRMFFILAEEMFRDNSVQGSITGGRHVGKATYIPAMYAKAQNEWMDSFMAQNGYIEYDALTRLGISDPKSTVKRRFKNDLANLKFLSECCVGEAIRVNVEAQIEEALSQKSVVDVMSSLPSVISDEDAADFLAEIVAKYDRAVVFGGTVVVSQLFLNDLLELFRPEVDKKANAMIASGKYAQHVKKMQAGNAEKFDVNEMLEQSKADKKEERRKKAAEGKGGGGTQGRETKTKSAKKNKGKKGKGGGGGDWSDDEEVSKKTTSSSTASALEFMSHQELEDKLGQVNALQDAPETLASELAIEFRPKLNKQFETQLATLFQSAMNASMQSRRRNHVDFQDKINVLLENIKLFEKGLANFDDDDGDSRNQLEKYLLKTMCSEVVNEAILYVCQEHEVSGVDTAKTDLNVDQRLKLIGQLPKDVGSPLASLNKSLTETVSEFIAKSEDLLPSGADITLRKSDRKKDRQIVFNHRQSLIQQLESCTDPALSLHLAALVIFQFQTGCMLHASGKFVPNILAKIIPGLEDDSKSTLTNYQNLVVNHMNAKDEDEKAGLQRQLEENLKAVKDAALSAKKSAGGS